MVIGVTNQRERDVKEKTTNKKRKSLGRRKARSLARRHRGNTLDLAAVKFRNGVGCCVLEGGKKKKFVNRFLGGNIQTSTPIKNSLLLLLPW